MEECFNETIYLLQEIISDENIAKTIKITMQEVINVLNNEEDMALKCDRALQTLTRNEDPNMDSLTRTQIWSVVSLLESMTR